MKKEQRILVNRIAQLCQNKGYSYYKLAYKASIPFSTLINIVEGKSKNPGIFTIMKICDALEVSLRDFFDTKDFELIVQEVDGEEELLN